MDDKVKKLIEHVAEEFSHWCYADFDRSMVIEVLTDKWEAINSDLRRRNATGKCK